MDSQAIQLVDALKAAGEPTRMRILALLSQGELSVGELVQILDQSQPRLSHHLKTLSQSGLVSRLPEGAWVFYRLARQGVAERLLRSVLSELDFKQPPFDRDRHALERVRESRASAAERYFADIAERWDTLRALHYPEIEIEAALLASAGTGPFQRIVDLGTGTGRMMVLFADKAREVEGLDFSHHMLTLARANLAAANIQNAHVRHGLVEAVPFANNYTDLVVLHQVLHYLDEPRLAILEAARILKPGGHILIIDFSPHNLEFLRERHGHRRLGIRDNDIADWTLNAGLEIVSAQTFAPPANLNEGLAVKLWKISKPSTLQKVAA